MAAGAKGLTQHNKVSIATARVVPVILALIVAYVSYVIVGPLCINYLINSPKDIPPRINAGIALPIVWFIILIPTAVTWFRLCWVVFLDPGYIPQTNYEWLEDTPAPPGLEDFYKRDVFVCDTKGLPLWCHHCQAWKPDRAHHSQDVGRCTAKMDHFCPWVGGVVGERSYKFFLQFLAYSFILSTYAMVLLAYFVKEDRHHAQWIVALGLAGFFVLFTLGMVINSLHMTFRNVTTIENIGMNPTTGTAKILLAVLLPPELQGQAEPILPPSSAAYRSQSSRSRSDGTGSERPLTSDLDDPSHSNYFLASKERPHRKTHRRPSHSEHWKGTVTYPLNLSIDRPPLPAPQFRTFAILETSPGSNPWDLGTPWRNFTAVFGLKFHQWFIPQRYSPCCDHSSLVSQYPLGPQFEQLLHDSGLVEMARNGIWQPDGSVVESEGKRERRRKKRALAEGWQNGERPDGWDSQKEARRARKQMRRRAEEDKRRQNLGV